MKTNFILALALSAAMPAVAADLPTPLLQPPMGSYDSTEQFYQLYASGVVLRNVALRLPQNFELPPGPGATAFIHSHGTVNMDVSIDGGATFQRISCPAEATTRVHSNGAINFDTEMLQLDLVGGGLPFGAMIRESPTLVSTGQTTITPKPNGAYQIDSFFDIFTELSFNGGQTWIPSSGSGHLGLRAPSGEGAFPTPNLPPSAPQLGDRAVAFANGVIVRNVALGTPTQQQPPPPPGGSQVHTAGVAVTGEVSSDGGATFGPFSAPANLTERVTSLADNGSTRFFDTEMLSLNISGGSLPVGVMLRESPTKASTGRTSIRMLPDNTYRIGSFFDIFTELSLDGGANWSPASSECVFALSETVTPTHAVVFTKGDDVPGVPNAKFAAFGVPAINASGQVAFLGKWSGGAGIFADGLLVAKLGDVVSGTAAIKTLKDPVIDDLGHVAFPCTLIGGGISAINDSAIVSNAPGGLLALVAQEGTTAPDAPAAALWKSFSSVAAPGGARGVLILGFMQQGVGGVTAANDNGLWSADSTGALHLMLREGTTAVGSKTVKSFAVLKTVSGTPGQTHAFNSYAELISKVTFATGEQTILHTNLP